METVVVPNRRQDVSPSRIPRPQTQEGVHPPAGETDTRLEGKLSRDTQQLSPSRIPRIAPPPPSERSLIPTARRHRTQQHLDDPQHAQKPLQQPVQQHASSKASPPAGRTQQGGLPRLRHIAAQHHQQEAALNVEQTDRLEPWDPPSEQQSHPQQPRQHPAQQRSRFPPAGKQQLQEHAAQQIRKLPGLKQPPQRQPRPQQQHSNQPPSKDPSRVAINRQPPEQRPHNSHASAADSGWLASRKMHEFLMSQQRKKESYWLSKYGRVLGPAAPSLGQPVPNPSSLFRHPAAHHTAAANSNSLRSSNSSPLKLPALPSTRSQRSIALEDSEAAHWQDSNRQQDARNSSRKTTPRVSNHDDVSHDTVGITAEPSRGGAALAQQQHVQENEEDEAAFEQIKAKITLSSVPRLTVTTNLTKPVLPAIAAVAGAGTAATQAALASGRSTPRRLLPCRDLEAELQVLKAIKAREDAVDKLRACCSRLCAAAGSDAAANMLLPSDPLGRLFYRLVSNLRLKTLDVIEAHAAWQRKVSGPPEPFTYKGKPYLIHMGEGLGFLDAAPWLAGRLLRCRAVEDCLLVELTPDGVPIDDVTSFDMRRGPGHFSPEALRVRMARKVLAAAGVQQPAATANSMTAALNQHQQQHYQVLQESSSNSLQQQEAPQQQQSHAAAVSAAAAALGILQRWSADGAEQPVEADDGDDNVDTVSPSMPEVVQQQQPPSNISAADSHDALLQQQQVIENRPQLTSQQNQQTSASRSHQLQEQQQSELPADAMQDANLQQSQQSGPQEHRHTVSVVDDLLGTLVSDLDGSTPTGSQEQQQDSRDVNNAEQHLAVSQQKGHQQQQHRHTASVVDDLLGSLVSGMEQASSASRLPGQRPTDSLLQEAVQQYVGMDMQSEDAEAAVDDMLESVLESLMVAGVDKYPAFTFSCSDWAIDQMLQDLVEEVECC